MRVLFVSHAFPPQGGGGVRRIVHLVTSLARAGCRVLVLAWSLSESASRRAGVPYDPEPLERLGTEPNIRQLWVPSPTGLYYWLRPLPRRRSIQSARQRPRDYREPAYALWAPFALARAMAARFDCVYATGPSFAAFLVGWAAAVARGKPLVLEYRDGWRLEPAIETAPWHARLLEAIEARLLRRAALVVVTTSGIGELLCRHYGLPPSRVALLRNGFVRSDATAAAPGWDSEGYHVAHVGALVTGRDTEPIIRAAATAGAVDGRPVVLHFVGVRPEDEAEIGENARRHGIADRVECRGFVPRRESLVLMAQSDALLLLLNTRLPEPRGAGIPGKLGDYLLANVPILASEAAAEILRLEFPELSTEPSPLDGHIFLALPRAQFDFEAAFRLVLERLPGYARLNNHPRSGD